MPVAYDGAVLEPFDKIMQDPAERKFIVVHLLGTHMNYQYRYPDNFVKYVTSEGATQWLDQAQLELYNPYDVHSLRNLAKDPLETGQHEADTVLISYAGHTHNSIPNQRL